MFASTEMQVSRYRARTSMQPHTHDQPSLNLIVDGDFRERINSSERRYATGDLAFCPAGAIHSQQFGAQGARQIIVTPQAAWLAYFADCKLRLADAPYARAAIFRQIGGRLLAELDNDDDFSGLAREGIVLEMVAAFGRRQSADTSAQPPAWLSAARDFIHENAFAPLGMRAIADAAGRHEIHLAREFRRFFGVSVGGYQRRLRAEQAACLLLRPHVNISELALECGFASHSHLCRVFKAHYGVSPSQYRARHVGAIQSAR